MRLPGSVTPKLASGTRRDKRRRAPSCRLVTVRGFLPILPKRDEWHRHSCLCPFRCIRRVGSFFVAPPCPEARREAPKGFQAASGFCLYGCRLLAFALLVAPPSGRNEEHTSELQSRFD